jgi:mono/diheme cytochrome c family protein
MEKRRMVYWALVAGAILMAWLVACGGGQGPAVETPAGEMSPTAVVSPAPPGGLTGQELLEARCTQCHTLDRVRSAAHTPEEWQATVQHMREMGAQLTDEEAQTLVQYLAETYGP